MVERARTYVVTGIDAAAEAIQRLAAACTRTPPVIGVTGPVASGKSTLARRLGRCVISTDAYLPNYEQTPEHARDLPESADLGLLLQHIHTLRTTGRANIPTWSFKTHRREDAREIWWTEGPIVIEGIHALDTRLRDQMDVKVLVDASRDSRWKRWEAIENAGERGWGVELARVHFDRIAEPTFHARMPALQQVADIIVWNDARECHQSRG